MKPGYKQTEVGVIPEEWMTCRLRDVVDRASPIAYGVLKPGDYIQNGIPLLQIRDVIYGEIDIDQLHRISEELDSQYSRTRLLGGEIVVSLVGTIGRVALLPVSLEGSNLHRNLARIHVSKAYDSKFICYFLNSDCAQAAIKLTTFGSTQALLNLADLRNLSVALPSLLEQRAIASALSDVDGLLGGLDRLIAKKRDLKQAAMQQLLTGQTRLPGFHGEWEVKRLGEVAEIVMGQSPSSSNYNTTGMGLPLIQGNADIDNRKTIKRIFTTHITKRGRNGDILMSVRAPVGEVSRAVFDVCLGRGVCAVRYDNDFIYHCLIYLEPTWAKHSKGSTFDSVNSADVKSLEIHLPTDQAEQTAIAEVLSEMDGELAVLEQRREKTRALKQAMMQELLTGKTRLV